MTQYEILVGKCRIDYTKAGEIPNLTDSDIDQLYWELGEFVDQVTTVASFDTYEEASKAFESEWSALAETHAEGLVLFATVVELYFIQYDDNNDPDIMDCLNWEAKPYIKEEE